MNNLDFMLSPVKGFNGKVVPEDLFDLPDPSGKAFELPVEGAAKLLSLGGKKFSLPVKGEIVGSGEFSEGKPVLLQGKIGERFSSVNVNSLSIIDRGLVLKSDDLDLVSKLSEGGDDALPEFEVKVSFGLDLGFYADFKRVNNQSVSSTEGISSKINVEVVRDESIPSEVKNSELISVVKEFIEAISGGEDLFLIDPKALGQKVDISNLLGLSEESTKVDVMPRAVLRSEGDGTLPKPVVLGAEAIKKIIRHSEELTKVDDRPKVISRAEGGVARKEEPHRRIIVSLKSVIIEDEPAGKDSSSKAEGDVELPEKEGGLVIGSLEVVYEGIKGNDEKVSKKERSYFEELKPKELRGSVVQLSTPRQLVVRSGDKGNLNGEGQVITKNGPIYKMKDSLAVESKEEKIGLGVKVLESGKVLDKATVAQTVDGLGRKEVFNSKAMKMEVLRDEGIGKPVLGKAVREDRVLTKEGVTQELKKEKVDAVKLAVASISKEKPEVVEKVLPVQKNSLPGVLKREDWVNPARQALGGQRVAGIVSEVASERSTLGLEGDLKLEQEIDFNARTIGMHAATRGLGLENMTKKSNMPLQNLTKREANSSFASSGKFSWDLVKEDDSYTNSGDFEDSERNFPDEARTAGRQNQSQEDFSMKDFQQAIAKVASAGEVQANSTRYLSESVKLASYAELAPQIIRQIERLKESGKAWTRISFGFPEGENISMHLKITDKRVDVRFSEDEGMDGSLKRSLLSSWKQLKFNAAQKGIALTDPQFFGSNRASMESMGSGRSTLKQFA